MLPPATWCCRTPAKLVWKSWREGWVAANINLKSTQAHMRGPAAAHTQPSPCLLFQADHVLAAVCSRHESPKCRRQLHAHLACTQVVNSPPYPVNMQDFHQPFRAQPAMVYVPRHHSAEASAWARPQKSSEAEAPARSPDLKKRTCTC